MAVSNDQLGEIVALDGAISTRQRGGSPCSDPIGEAAPARAIQELAGHADL